MQDSTVTIMTIRLNQDVIEVEDTALSSSGGQDLEHVCRLGTVKLYSRDFESLADGRWLTSGIIDAALTLAAEELKNTLCHLLTSEVWELLRPGYKLYFMFSLIFTFNLLSGKIGLTLSIFSLL